MKKKFQLQSPYKPAGDQPKAIKKLVAGFNNNKKRQTLLGTTGSGKTMTMANVIQQLQKPTLVISHNKTLAAQLTEEFRQFFPNNKVEYFVSYYDYYQPEAYIAKSDTYISKDASINDEIDKLRHATMESLLTRDDVIVVASVSCIYGLGSPEEFVNSHISLRTKQKIDRKELIKQLNLIQYTRNDMDLTRGSYRVRGDTIDIYPSGEDNLTRIEFFGPSIENITILDALTGKHISSPKTAHIFPATLFITSEAKKEKAITSIKEELAKHRAALTKKEALLAEERITQRTTYDLEMLENIGYMSGIENYSRHFDGRKAGTPPTTLLDYFAHSYKKDGFLTFIDESHMTIPQINAMHGGDAARKKNLIEHGFRLPSAKDNRPLKFNEFEDRINQTMFVSATPADYEKNTSDSIVEQIIRPTGLLDPTIEIKPIKNQVDDVIDQIKEQIKKKQRVLVTTLTKRMAEELSTYLTEMGMKAAYIHSDVSTLDRLDILHDLRKGIYDVLVGINLLREGLDLPEVSLIAIMDADKEGYLRSETALVQTMGRAARHVNGHVIMYADRITGSMQRAIDETDRRRKIQKAYNKKHNITPKSIEKKIQLQTITNKKIDEVNDEDLNDIPPEEREHAIKEMKNKMQLASQNLEFEEAARLRDTIKALRQKA